MLKKHLNRKKRHYRIRKKVIGSKEIPRLSVRRSLANLHVQIVDDVNEKVLIGMSTSSKELKGKMSYGGNIKAATVLAEAMSEKMKQSGVERICFDRGGYQYAGRIKAFAEVLRAKGIKF